MGGTHVKAAIAEIERTLREIRSMNPRPDNVQSNSWWGTRLKLRSWVGYQSRLGPCGSIDRPDPSDGTVDFIFSPGGRGLEPLSSVEAKLVRWFERNEPTVSQAVKKAVISWCSPLCFDRKRKFSFGRDFPKIETEEDLKRYIGLYAINIHHITPNGLPYIGYEFGCDWEEKHGLGVLMHGTRAVDVGFADVAFLSSIAEEDAKRSG